MIRISSPEAMTEWAETQRAAGRRIGFVPTMGYLHRGHTSLMSLLRPVVDDLVVSIYVNPLQFEESHDLDSYPRDLEGDARQCEAVGVDCIFTPSDLYPDGFCTAVSVDRLTDNLCGATRPGHFDGLCRAEKAHRPRQPDRLSAVDRRLIRPQRLTNWPPPDRVGGLFAPGFTFPRLNVTVRLL